MEDLIVQLYLWVATLTSLAAAAWVAKTKLFSAEDEQQAQEQQEQQQQEQEQQQQQGAEQELDASSSFSRVHASSAFYEEEADDDDGEGAQEGEDDDHDDGSDELGWGGAPGCSEVFPPAPDLAGRHESAGEDGWPSAAFPAAGRAGGAAAGEQGLPWRRLLLAHYAAETTGMVVYRDFKAAIRQTLNIGEVHISDSELQVFFEIADRNGDGWASTSDLRQLLSSDASDACLGEGLPETVQPEVQSTLVVQHLISHLDGIQTEVLGSVYGKYGAGQLDAAKLRGVMGELGFEATEQEAGQVLLFVDTDGRGSASIKDLLKSLKCERQAGQKAAAMHPTNASGPSNHAAQPGAPAGPEGLVPSPGKGHGNGEHQWFPGAGELPQGNGPQGVKSDHRPAENGAVSNAPSAGALHRVRLRSPVRPKSSWGAAVDRSGKRVPASTVPPASSSGLGSPARSRRRRPSAAQTAQALGLFDTGCQYMQANRLLEAERDFRKALVSKPEFPECQRRLAVVKRRQATARAEAHGSFGLTPVGLTPVGTGGRARTGAGPWTAGGLTTHDELDSVVPGMQARGTGTPGRVEPASITAFKERHASQDLVSRLYGWQDARDEKLAEKLESMTPSFTPNQHELHSELYLPDPTRGDEVSYDERQSLVDRCYQWQRNRDEKVQERLGTALDSATRPRKATSTGSCCTRPWGRSAYSFAIGKHCVLPKRTLSQCSFGHVPVRPVYS